MKLGIFGDSFAANDQLPSYDPSFTVYQTWVDMLSKKFEVTNHAVSNSSVFYSYTQFIKFYKNYDYIIFHVTSFDRLYLEDANNIITADGKKICHVKANIRQMLDVASLKIKRNLEIVNAIEMYYVYVLNNEKEKYFSNFMINEMKEKNKDVIFLDLWSWCYKENDFYSWNGPLSRDYRRSHLTKKNHEMVYNYILDKVMGKNLELNEYYRDPEEPFKFYFRSSRP